MNINQSKQQDSIKIKSGCLISKIPAGYNESLLVSSNIYVPESVSNIYQVSVDLDGLIKNAAKEKNIDHEFIINDDKITAYFVDEKDLYVKCNLFDYCNIEWFIEKNKSLLSIGIVKINGTFDRGDVISILDENNVEFARGIANYDSIDCIKIMMLLLQRIILL